MLTKIGETFQHLLNEILWKFIQTFRIPDEKSWNDYQVQCSSFCVERCRGYNGSEKRFDHFQMVFNICIKRQEIFFGEQHSTVSHSLIMGHKVQQIRCNDWLYVCRPLVTLPSWLNHSDVVQNLILLYMLITFIIRWAITQFLCTCRGAVAWL